MGKSLQQNFVRINGVKLYYGEYNKEKNKPTVVLLHGFLSSSFCFRKLIPYLTNEFHVISVDWPPFGKSEKPKRFYYSFKNIAETIIRLLVFLGMNAFMLLGIRWVGKLLLI